MFGRQAMGLDGRTWRVGRQWAPRLERRGLRAHLPRRRKQRDQNRAGESHWWHAVEFLDIDSPGAIAVAVLIVVFVIFMIFIGGPLLLALFDVVVWLVLLLLGVLARVLMGRPWVIEAVASDGERRTWHERGWRHSIRRKREVVTAIETGTIAALPTAAVDDLV